jgi:hypothetical protein
MQQVATKHFKSRSPFIMTKIQHSLEAYCLILKNSLQLDRVGRLRDAL